MIEKVVFKRYGRARARTETNSSHAFVYAHVPFVRRTDFIDNFKFFMHFDF